MGEEREGENEEGPLDQTSWGGSNRRCRESRTKMPIAEVDPNFYSGFLTL